MTKPKLNLVIDTLLLLCIAAITGIGLLMKYVLVQVVTYVRKGRFTSLSLEVIEKEKPSLVVTTRPRRPAWLRNLFGSSVDHLTSHAGFPVIEV